METSNGYETVSLADLNEDTIIAFHPLASTDTRGTLFTIHEVPGKPLPELRICYTQDFGSPVQLQKNIPKHLIADNGASPWLTQATHENTHVIVSTLSGTCLATDFFEKTVSPLLASVGLQSGKEYTVHYTESADSITELCLKVLLINAKSGKWQNIILLSGDGGIVDILNALMSEFDPPPGYVEPVVSIIPMGTGNALAHSSGITKDKSFGLRSLLCGTPKHLPVFRATFSEGSRLLVDEGRQEEGIKLKYHGKPILYGAVVCSWGLHASLVADSDTAEYRKFGAERFQMAAKENLFPPEGPHTYKGRLTLALEENAPATEWKIQGREDHAYILATMVSNLEEKFKISPASKPLDGSMRVVHFGPMEGKEVIRVMGMAYDGGKHVDDPAVEYKEIEGLRLEFKEEDGRWRRVCIDGKIVRVEKDGELLLTKEKRQALKIRVPAWAV